MNSQSSMLLTVFKINLPEFYCVKNFWLEIINSLFYALKIINNDKFNLQPL